MFKVVINLKDVGEYEKFSDAFRVFFSEFKKAVKSGTVIPHVLEAASFIVYPWGNAELIMDFACASEFGRQNGLLKIAKGELELGEELPEPELFTVQIAFIRSTKAAIESAI